MIFVCVVMPLEVVIDCWTMLVVPIGPSNLGGGLCGGMPVEVVRLV